MADCRAVRWLSWHPARQRRASFAWPTGVALPSPADNLPFLLRPLRSPDPAPRRESRHLRRIDQ
ncbi:MAG: hypothetical protein OXK76_03190, partial [Gammaproteobacteria bacterium]|nr:hypothetical protein [Gammaproteobacteria bacterium]